MFVLSFFCISDLSASAATVTVTKTGTGQGTVVSSDQSTCALSCNGSSCTCTAATGALVRLSEVPASGSLFGGWGGACSGGNQTCSFTVPATSAVSVEARFQATAHSLSVSKNGDGTGTIVSSPSGINCGSSCSGNFPANTPVTLTANPSASSGFLTWSGISCQGGNNQVAACGFVMDGPKTVTATFGLGHRLTVSKNGNGTVTSSPSGINCGSQCSMLFPGTNPSVTLTATPGSGQRFKEWANGASSCGTNATCTLTLNEDKAVLATFEALASCTGKDSSGVTQTGTCSTSATCSSGNPLTDATGCESGKACCYSAPPGSSCDMSKCSTTECTQGNNNSLCAAECKNHFGTSGEYYYCESTQGGSGNYCSASENPGIVPCARSCDNPNTVDDETKICTLCHLLLLIRNITDWIFMVMTYIAFAVLVAMGILYIVSTGKPQLTGMAKSGIWAALVGFAIVLLGWVAINVILMVLADGALGSDTASFAFKTNGKWFEYNCDTQTRYTGTGGTGTGGGSGGDGSGGNLNCKDGKCAKMSDVASAAKSNASGIDPDIVMAIIDAGEGCNKSLSTDGYGSCGYSQALPSIRAKCGITGSASESCAKIQNNVQLDLNCAAWLIKDNAGRCGMDIRNVASCYNSGKPNNCANTTNRYCDRVETYYKSCKGQ